MLSDFDRSEAGDGSAFPREKRRRQGEERERERSRVPERPRTREGNRNGA